MADTSQPSGPSSRATLGLTGLTSNAMALIAPGAFLWLTYYMQSAYGAPMAAQGMWFGIAAAIALCLATAVSYAELSKLYPGAGSSYFFAEQAFLSKAHAFRYARLAKFIVGWASHLYYWVYPGVMVGVTALVSGYMLGQLFPNIFNASVPSPVFMILFCAVFAFAVAFIAFRGVGGTTGINAVINVIQITALIIFSIMAIGYRMQHPAGSKGWTLGSDGLATQVVQVTDKDGKPVMEADGKTPKTEPFIVEFSEPVANAGSTDDKNPPTFQYHATAGSVVAPHNFSFVIVQACIAILILVGFESVTAMGEEAKNAKRDIPLAVLLSLVIQGVFCYLIEYFAANYFLNNGYKNPQALGSAAPVGDMMQIVGAFWFGSATAGWWFMFVQGITVFLALIGTTLSCMTTGARVTYAMGRDEELGAHFGMLHSRRLTPHRAIWTLAALSAVIGVFAIFFNFCGPCALTDDTIKSLPSNGWYGFGIFGHDTAAKIPQSMLVVTLVSNFGTFLLYMMTCIAAIVAFREHHSFNGFKHMFVPVFGLLANLLCMLFFIVGPFVVPNMSPKEPFFALGICALWAIYGAVYFSIRSKKTGKPIVLGSKPEAATATVSTAP
ncbi:MAG TPA: APC family permease [Tepidisphaeraceae bacterium]